MTTPLDKKSTVQQIRSRFDSAVERFSNLETGQVATVDAPLAMELINQAAIATSRKISRVLDIGCGAGNNILKLLRSYGGDFDCDLVDLSRPMLDRAQQRVRRETRGRVTTIQEDIREAELPGERYDVALAAAVLHHLRDERDWLAVFSKIHELLKPGGSFWITDLVIHEDRRVQRLMWNRYAEYLEECGGEEFRDKVFGYIDKEDSPRPVT